VAEVDPVMLGGVLVRRVTLHNAQTVQRLCIAAGDRVKIALVADIIPQVQEVQRQDGRAACPDSASGGTAAESGMAACLSDTPGCREHFLARAVHFVSRAGLNVPGLGPGRLRKLIASGLVHDLPSLLRLKTEEVAAVSGFTAQSALRLTEALKQVGRPEQIQLLKALGIPGVGPVAAKRLVKEFGTLEAMLSPDERQDGGVAAQNVRKFFQTPQGQELLRGLREVNLL
jgi:DNA ligase (NAD+)